MVLLAIFVWFACGSLWGDVWSAFLCSWCVVVVLLLLRVSVFGVVFVSYCVMRYGLLLLCCCCVCFL